MENNVRKNKWEIGRLSKNMTPPQKKSWRPPEMSPPDGFINTPLALRKARPPAVVAPEGIAVGRHHQGVVWKESDLKYLIDLKVSRGPVLSGILATCLCRSSHAWLPVSDIAVPDLSGGRRHHRAVGCGPGPQLRGLNWGAHQGTFKAGLKLCSSQTFTNW